MRFAVGRGDFHHTRQHGDGLVRLHLMPVLVQIFRQVDEAHA